MSVKFYICDGEGTNNLAGVTPDHALKMTVVDPAVGTLSAAELTAKKQLRAFLMNGASADMNVDGSSTAVEFEQAAENGLVKYFTGVRLLMNDTNLEMDSQDFRRFASATSVNTPLTNGVELFVEQGGVATNFFIDPIVRVGEFFDYADRFTNLINAVTSQEDFLSFDFDFDMPVVLPEGSLDRIVIKVQDDLTDLSLFRAVGRGYKVTL